MTRPTATIVDEDHRHASLQEAVSRVRVIAGLPLTAYLANANSVHELTTSLRKPGDGDEEKCRARLLLVLALATEFRSTGAVSLMRAWLREIDEDLGHTSPAALIRASASDKLHLSLQTSAVRYLAAARHAAA